MTRTPDLRITNAPLYQLSYAGTRGAQSIFEFVCFRQRGLPAVRMSVQRHKAPVPAIREISYRKPTRTAMAQNAPPHQTAALKQLSSEHREAEALRRHCGFSLLETAIAMAIMAVGLSGLAALLIRTVSGTTLSSQRTSAFWLAESLAAQAQLNPAGMTAMLAPNPQGVDCSAADACSPMAFAATSYAAWQAEVAAALPGGAGRVCRDQFPEEGRAACDGTGPIVIKISWSAPGGTEQHTRVLRP